MPHPWLQGLTRVDEVGSTSDLALGLVRSAGFACPHLVRADRQTRGRGRGSNAWWSDGGSLTFTLVIDPAAHGLTAAHEPRLALTAAVAAVSAVAGFVPPAARLGIRWPNDVEADGRKLGGVLPEPVETPVGPRFLIGVGLNVRTRLADAPHAVRDLAASLTNFPAGPAVGPDPEEVLDRWLGHFAALLPDLAADRLSLADRWSALDLLRDTPVRVDLGPRILRGVARGITPAGALLLATPNDGLIPLFGGRVLRD